MKSVDVDGAIEIINVQIRLIGEAQAKLAKPAKGAKQSGMALSKMTSQVMTMARGLAAYQAEMRKTGSDVDEQVKTLTSDRVAELALQLIGQLSPEHRAAVALHIEELAGKLISHGGA